MLSGRRGTPAGRELDDLVRELGVTVVPFAEAEWHVALKAFAAFGRGRHQAGLNFGDCLSDATAAVGGDSLLYAGDDFSRTDIVSAL